MANFEQQTVPFYLLIGPWNLNSDINCDRLLGGITRSVRILTGYLRTYPVFETYLHEIASFTNNQK